MLESILQGLREVEGVQGAMIVDPSAAVIAHRAHSIYDPPVLQQVARSIVNSIDSVQLIQDDWDILTAHFGDGKLLLRSLRTAGGKPRRYILAVIADASLNVAFLGVALRVAASKLLVELESNPSGSGVSAAPIANPSHTTGRIPIADQSRPEVARTGISWSGVSSGSGVGGSDIVVADNASSAFLSACTKALAASVGPMAKVFVKEAVRKVCGERPFSRADGPALLAQLAAAIDDSDDRATFQRATRALEILRPQATGPQATGRSTMLEPIKRRLSLKVSIILALITIPPMVAAAYFITAREAANQEQLTIDAGKVAAQAGAEMYGAALEAGVDSGAITIGDLFELKYEEIRGFDFGDNPRYHTKYDFYTDRVVVGFQDTILASSPDFLYAVGGDLNGYTPTHDSKFTRPLTGDRTKDLAGHRAKRKFWTPMHQSAAKNLEPVLVQPYVRDTGERAWDVSSPIFIKGRHFGAFRVAVSLDSIAAHKRALLLQLAIVFGFLAVVTVGFIFVMLRRSMRPLEHLATLASEISTGEGLDKPIKPTTTDEIGQMAKSLNRLRASLQAAMGRLGE